ncbi:uncharacterized protein LOC106170029 [Lingula anatina]|uniref:Uncharacterized protein LOC106170029 n=1 Tax=Lingula anatina TaxID=7574 RepID=A0A1S3J4I7_LINAN|nr:uncharacterized protein LOC106170029 [Lingula anatina]|eukprot:XP_013405193.1 uncharacterized protein LOC106170029 [Lingula anatina]
MAHHNPTFQLEDDDLHESDFDASSAFSEGDPPLSKRKLNTVSAKVDRDSKRDLDNKNKVVLDTSIGQINPSLYNGESGISSPDMSFREGRYGYPPTKSMQERYEQNFTSNATDNKPPAIYINDQLTRLSDMTSFTSSSDDEQGSRRKQQPRSVKANGGMFGTAGRSAARRRSSLAGLNNYSPSLFTRQLGNVPEGADAGVAYRSMQRRRAVNTSDLRTCALVQTKLKTLKNSPYHG